MVTLPHLRQLPRPLARLCLSVERFCLRSLRLSPDTGLVLAVSGGADSTALACIFALLRPRLGLRLSALTINHSLREGAAADAAHAQEVCARLAIPCQYRSADVAGLAQARGLGLEEAGRHVRYHLLEEARREQKADFIATGHHAEDLSEDVLLRMLRGTGWPSLGGMPARDDTRHIVRPLLQTAPAALKTLVRSMGLSWREDESNADTLFTRNRLRHTVLPLLRRENPALEAVTARLWQLARWDADYWDSVLTSALGAHPPQEKHENSTHSLTLSRALLAGLHPAARLRLFHMVIRRLYAKTGREHQGQARADTLFRLEEALHEGRGNTCFQFPGGLTAHLQGGSVRFCLNVS